MTLKKKKMQELIEEIVGESFSIGNITDEHLKFGMTICRKDVEAVKVVQDNSLELEKLIENLDENILPRPVIRDGNGKFTRLYSTRDWFLKLQEEIFEVFEAMESGRDDEFDELCAEELADVITVCTSWLETLGYDEEKRSEIFRKVNEKNEKRGYFKETDSNGD